MVRIRNSKLYRLLAGTNIFLPHAAFAKDGTVLPDAYEKYNLKDVHPINLDEYKSPEVVADVKEVKPADLPDSGLSDPVKEQKNTQSEVSPLKRRKRHKRKSVLNQEQSVMRGVYFKNMKWQAAIKVEKKQIHLGTVGSQEEAARLYDRAAYMCGREPNFELAEEEKQELSTYKWDEFLSMTRQAITHKKSRRRVGAESVKKSESSPPENEEDMDLSGSEVAEPEISDS